MSCIMTLIPSLPSLERLSFRLPLEDGSLFAPSEGFVYTHCSYEVKLSDWDGPAPSLSELQKADILVNDEPTSVQWRKCGASGKKSGKPEPPAFQGRFAGPGMGRIFRDAFGFSEIHILLRVGGTVLHLHSGFLKVKVRDQQLTDSVRTMVDSVYSHQENFLLSGEAKSRIHAGFRRHGKRDLFTMLALAQEAAAVFENSYPYFKANCRFQIQKTPTVQPLERLQSISPATLQYTACHPEELRPASGNTGIRFGRRQYQPRRALGMVNQASMETYENQALLGFLKTLLADVRRLRANLDALADAAREQQDGEWISTPFLMLAPVRKYLTDASHPMGQLEGRLSRLLRIYSRILPINAPKLHHAPKPTAVFRSVPEYNRIFTCCRRWFQFGLYDLDSQKNMLPFLKIPDLYEVYILIRLFSALHTAGWKETGRERVEYPPLQDNDRNWPVPPSFENVFSFQKKDTALTVFYQPVVYSGLARLEGKFDVGLCRNTSVSYKEEDNPFTEAAAVQGSYYLPDFLLKIQRGNRARFIVADAKFSSLRTVERYQLPALVYKYLFSLSPRRKDDVLAGLCIFSGQAVDVPNEFRNLRNLYPSAPEPFAAILAFPGGSVEEPLTELLRYF